MSRLSVAGVSLLFAMTTANHHPPLLHLPGTQRPTSDSSSAEDPEEAGILIENLRRRHPARMGIALRDAREIHCLATGGGFLELGFASVGQLAESLSLSAAEGLRLFAVGRALAAWPAVESMLITGRLNLDKAAALAHLLDVPGSILPGEDWLEMAQRETTVRFQRRVNRRIEETLRGEPVERMAFWVTQDCKDGFRRARTLASRAAERRLTRGETLHLLVDRFLDAVDPLRIQARARRTGSTEGTPGRHIPEEVRRFVRRRAEDVCEFPLCPYDLWLDFAHIVPHREGGSREADNLLLLCTRHHRWVDSGMVGMERRGDKVAFTLRNGAVLPGPELLPPRLGPPPVPVPASDDDPTDSVNLPGSGIPPPH